MGCSSNDEPWLRWWLAMVDASRLLGHQTHEHKNKIEEKKRVTQVMSKRDGNEREQEWRRWRW
ncbi:hypothetical protein F2Q69_00038398 [Brassica cretica]|uniref:Uncharacterized protein n=1 Tax=Brassica cretica TaxID=69181 RepID=A0A8S9SRC3_BRACR|nr:hypothetical protein F2Q69_00038398 [Brassica cretica]